MPGMSRIINRARQRRQVRGIQTTSHQPQQHADEAYSYDRAFMDSAAFSNLLSARAIIHLLLQYLRLSSVLDVGCATGTWLKEWKAAGVADVCGIDGGYVNQEHLRIAP